MNPWIQSNGNSRPYLFEQKVMVSNGNPEDDTLKSNVTLNRGNITFRGIRTSLQTLPFVWTDSISANTMDGNDEQKIGELAFDGDYFIQPYASNGVEVFMGKWWIMNIFPRISLL